MSIERREVYLVMKQLPDGRVLYVEGLKCASNYFFDGHSGVGIDARSSSSFVEFSEGDKPMQLFHMPNQNYNKWQAAYHDFGCDPMMGEPKKEFIIFVGAFSNDRERTTELMCEGLNRAWEIIDGERELRDGEFED